jgi:hypothetical protein
VQDAEADRLHRLAAGIALDDPDVASSWELVLEAVRVGWMNGHLLDEFIAAIDAGRGRGVEEFGIDVAEDDPVRVEVWFIQDERTCSRAGMRDALQRLRVARDEVAAAVPPADAPARRRRRRR